MKYIFALLFIHITYNSPTQGNKLLLNKKYFDNELRAWANTFVHFNLSDFKLTNTMGFDNNQELDFQNYKTFLSTYKPIITYSRDNSKFLDIYSYQLNLKKKDTYYEASPEMDQVIYLCYPQKKYWSRIYFGTNSLWIEEVTWISNTKFILAGIKKSTDDKKIPLILIGDSNKQTLEEYLTKNKACFQNANGYESPKLKRMKIKGL